MTKKPEYKYTLIISQYYHSRHFFIVHHTEDFLTKAKEFSQELMKHKRDENNKKELYCGDIDYQLDNGHDGITAGSLARGVRRLSVADGGLNVLPREIRESGWFGVAGHEL